MEIKCPTCEKTVVWSKESEFKPFCSERCRLIDLGQWAAEEHRIPCAQQENALELDELPTGDSINLSESSDNLH